jgi:hypothetical protein
MSRFKALIQIIGINPYVAVPASIGRAFQMKGFIPVKIKVNGHPFLANLVPVGGNRHRLYLHGVMRKKAKADVGDKVVIEVAHDPKPRVEPMSPHLAEVLKVNGLAYQNWKYLSPSRKKELNRYLNRLKSDEAVRRTLSRIVKYLAGKGDWFNSRL